MRIRTKEDYIRGLKEQNHVVYYRGKRVSDVTEHKAFIPHINAAAKTYEMALMPEFEDLATAGKPSYGKQDQSVYPYTPVSRRSDQKGKVVEGNRT